MNIAVVYGSYRNHRQGIKGAKFICQELEKRNHNASLIDAKEYNLPFLDKMYKEYEDEAAPENMKKLSNLLLEADGFVIVSGEYNHSIPPGLKNLLDHFQKEYFFKPSGLVTYSAGTFGGVRVGIHLRALVAELGMPSIPSMLALSKIQDSFTADGEAIDTAYIKRADRFLSEFEWYVRAFKEERAKGVPY